MSAAPGVDDRTGRDRPGFYGKLPSHGDYVTRRLPPDLISSWTAWLDAGLDYSRATLGETWLAGYLAAPLWCFSLSPGCCGPRPLAGVVMPSVDRVGRYYPLSILSVVEGDKSAAEIAAEAVQWFARMEELALFCLADDFDFHRFDAALANEISPTADDAEPAVPSAAIPRLLGRLLEHRSLPYSLWWTTSERPAGATACRVFPGLPDRAEFCKLLETAGPERPSSASI